MERIIAVPHLPEGEVRYLIIGKKYQKFLENALFEYKISLICAENNIFVDNRLSGHVDLSIVHMGENKMIAAEYLKDSELINRLKGIGFIIKYVENPIRNVYPYDAHMNVCVIGDCVICNTKTANAELTAGRKIIKCKQGYTKCSVLAVDEKSIITSDKIIAENTAMNGIESLLIDDSFVKLPGFKKGFIGGAAFKISKDKIAFTGIIADKKTKTEIERFLNERNIEAVYLTDEEIFDIGSAIPIIEEL